MAPELSSARSDELPPMTGEVAVPGHPCILDTGVPWVRTGSELRRECARLTRAGNRLLAGPFGQGAAPRELENLIGGMAAAMAWTLGAFPLTPILRRERPVTGAAIREELDASNDWMEERRPGWAKVAGAVHWLMWMTGVIDTLDLGALDPDRPVA